MRTTLAGVFALLLVAGVARTTMGQLPAGSKIQGIYSKDEQARKAKLEALAVASAQQEAARQPYRVEMWVPEPLPAGYVQPAGYGYPVPDSGVQPAGHGHAAGHGQAPACDPRMMGGGTYPHGTAYDWGHPGRHFDGGRYGYFGGAHRTPGYPHHHHMNREYVGPQGPPTAAVAYPYYTIRGPRDFFLDNPPSIGR